MVLLSAFLLAANQPAAASGLAADSLRLVPEQSSTLPYPGVTAVFSLHPDVAGAALEGEGAVLIRGRAAGFAQVVLVFRGGTRSVAVTVEDPPPSRRTTDRHQSGKAWQFGTFDVHYASEPQIAQTTVRVSRQDGADRSDVLFGGAWRVGNASDRMFTVPMGSYVRTTGASEVALFDRTVDTSPLTLSQANIRGVHVRSHGWTAHAGYSAFANFEGLLLPVVKEAVAGVGYDIRLTDRSIITPQVYHFRSPGSASHTGPMASLVYRTRRDGVSLETEIGAGRSLAVAAELDASRPGEALWARLRITPPAFPSLTTGSGAGRMIDVSWKRAAHRVALSANGSAHSNLTGSRHRSAVLGARAELPLTPRLTTSAGATFSEFGSRLDPSIHRLSVPAGLRLRAGRTETTVDYELSRTGSDLIGHSIRAGGSAAWRQLRLSAFGEQQQHVPTVRQIFGAAPWIAQRLEQLAIHATTTSELAHLLRTNSTLGQLGYAGELAVNVTPRVSRFGGSLDATLFRDRTRVTLSTMYAREDLIVGESRAATQTVSVGQQLAASTELLVDGSIVCSDKHRGVNACRPVVAVSLRQQMPKLPLGLLGRPSSGDITGIVFQDDEARGTYAAGLPVLSDVDVILNGQQRTKTDRAGRFRFRRVPAGSHVVEVRFSGALPFFFTTASRVQAAPDADLTFGIGFSLGRMFGTVRNDAGAPVNDLLLRIASAGREWIVRTAGEGQFALEGLPAGVYDVRIDRASIPSGYRLTGLEPVSARVQPGSAGHVLVTLHAQRAISGVVRAYVPCAGTYEPVAGAAVRLQHGAERTTDEHGRFVFRDVGAGLQRLHGQRGTLMGGTELQVGDGPDIIKDVILTLRDRSRGESITETCGTSE